MIVFDRKRRALLFFTGIMMSGFGVALSTLAGLGATPIASVPWVITFLCPLSYGMLNFVMNMFFVSAQIAILRRRFGWFQLLQIPAMAIFAAFMDVGVWLVRPYETTFFPVQLVMLVCGSAMLGVGISCQVQSDFLCVPGDALVKTISREFHFKLSRVKICFDALLVLTACVISFLTMHTIQGVREGTIIGVFLVGFFVGVAMPRLRWARRLCYHRVSK